jgi:hypothetical protein
MQQQLEAQAACEETLEAEIKAEGTQAPEEAAEKEQGKEEGKGKEGHDYYDAFLSCRVWCDSGVAEKVYWALKSRGLKVFWGKRRLQPGAPWEEGFVEGLQESRHVAAFVSEQALQGIAGRPLTSQGDALGERALAAGKLEANSRYIAPVLVGEYVDLGGGGQQALKEFNAFGGLQGKPWPPEHSAACASRTTRGTMGKLFAIQGTHLDPQAADVACGTVHPALAASPSS